MFKKVIPLLICILVLASMLSVQAENRITARLSYNTSDFQLVTGDRFVSVLHADGENVEYSATPGEPRLPVRNVAFLVDSAVEEASVEVKGDFTEVALDSQVYPCQQPVVGGGSAKFTEPAAAIYGSNCYYPTTLNTGHKLIVTRGIKTLHLTVYPVTYNPVANKLRIYTTLTIRVTMTDSAQKLHAPAARFEQFRIKSVRNVLNPEDAAKYMPVLDEAGLTRPEATIAYKPGDGIGPMPVASADVDYLIITSESLATAFESLAEWKTQIGYPAEIITIEDIYDLYNGDDNPEKIRNCVIDYYKNKGTRFLLLGGDSTIVPVRACPVVCGSYSEPAMPTDAYYGCLDGAWDLDDDGIFGEPADDVDLGFEVMPGRLPARTSEDVAVFINKLLKYEKTPPTSNFAKNIMFSGTTLWNTYPGENVTPIPYDHTASDAEIKGNKIQAQGIDQYWAYAESNPVLKFYNTWTSFDTSAAGDYPLSPTNLQAKLTSERLNYFTMLTHGSTTAWGMETGGNYSTTHAAAMASETPFIIYTMACNTNGFDTGTDPCLSEAFIRNPNGAVAYMGSSRYGWGYADQSVEYGASEAHTREFFKQIFKNSPRTLGEAFCDHKETFIPLITGGSTRWLYYGINLMGDPAMGLLTDDPAVLSPTFTSEVTTGSVQVEIDAGLPNINICLMKESEVYYTGSTGSDGMLTAHVSPTTNGIMDITFSGQNILYSSGKIYVNNPPTLIPDDTSFVLQEGGNLSFNVTVSDEDANDTLTLEAIGLPPGAMFDFDTGEFTWDTTWLDAGLYTVTFTVTDDFGDNFSGGTNASVTVDINIEVLNTNRPVLIHNTVTEFNISEDQPFALTIDITDEDTDDIIASSTSLLPDGALFDDMTGLVSWTPSFLQAGSYTITVTVMDDAVLKHGATGNSESIFEFTINVANVNRLPQITGVTDRQVNEEDTLSFQIAWSDEDTDDTVVVSLANIPTGASFDAETGQFSWIPTKLQEGRYDGITYTISDGHSVTQQTFSITVNDPLPPVILIAESYDDNSSGGINRLRIIFDEPVHPVENFIASAFTVLQSAPDTWQQVDEYTFDLFFSPAILGTGAVELANAPISVSQIFDSVGNSLQPFTGRAVTDKAAPVVMEVIVADLDSNGFPDRYVFVFSEAVTAEAANLAAWLIFDSTGSVDMLSGLTANSVVHSGNRLTFNLSNDRGNLLTPIYKSEYGTVTDSMGNMTQLNTNTPPVVTPIADIPQMMPSLLYLSVQATDGGASASLTYLWEILSGPSLPAITGAGQAQAQVKLFVAGVYFISVTVTDLMGDSTVERFTVKVVDLPPMIVADDLIVVNIDSQTALSLDASRSYDPNGDSITYTWAANANAGLSTTTSATPGIAPTIAGVYEVLLTVTDSQDNESVKIVTIYAMSADNSPPVARTLPGFTAVVGEVVGLNGSYSHDADGDTIFFTWSQTAGAPVTLNDAQTVLAIFTPTVAGMYTFELDVADGDSDGLCAYITIHVITGGANSPPCASAGGDFVAPFAPFVQLDGSASFDGDGDDLQYEWTVIYGPAVLSNPTSAQPSFAPCCIGTYIFSLTVFDGINFSAMDKVTVHVTDEGHTPPTIELQASSVASEPVSSETILLSVTCTDEDSTQFSCFWEPVNGTYSVLGQRGISSSFQARAAGIYSFRCTVTDGTFIVSGEISIPVSLGGTLPFASAIKTRRGSIDNPITLRCRESEWVGDGAFWVQVSGPTTVLLSDRTSMSPEFTTPVIGKYVFNVYATQGNLISKPDTVTVTVTGPSSGGGGGCFVATATWGSMCSESVRTLCDARDGMALQSSTGSCLVGLYYALSPDMARATGASEAVRALLREMGR